MIHTQAEEYTEFAQLRKCLNQMLTFDKPTPNLNAIEVGAFAATGWLELRTDATSSKILTGLVLGGYGGGGDGWGLRGLAGCRSPFAQGLVQQCNCLLAVKVTCAAICQSAKQHMLTAGLLDTYDREV